MIILDCKYCTIYWTLQGKWWIGKYDHKYNFLTHNGSNSSIGSIILSKFIYLVANQVINVLILFLYPTMYSFIIQSQAFTDILIYFMDKKTILQCTTLWFSHLLKWTYIPVVNLGSTVQISKTLRKKMYGTFSLIICTIHFL
jgi:hypothetical protein